jgi:hypothetical protein
LALKYEQRAPQSHALGEVIGIADRINGNFLKLQDKPLKRFFVAAFIDSTHDAILAARRTATA